MRALEWLRARHDVSLVPSPEYKPVPAASGGRASALGREGTRAIRARLQPAYLRQERVAVDELIRLGQSFDWIWLAQWPLSWSVTVVPSWRSRGVFVSWDEDALSRSRWTSAKALAIRRPIRSATRLIAAGTAMTAERRHLSTMSLVVARSPVDATWLRRVQRAPVATLANTVDLRLFQGLKSASDAQPVALFVGSDYEPNVDGIEWFLRTVWTRVQTRRPEARLLIVGNRMERFAGRWSRESVEVVGHVPDVRPYFEASRIVVCPVFYGGGSPLKLLEAAAAARPVVTTRYCARAVEDRKHAMDVPTSRAAWADAILKYLDDPAVSRTAGEHLRAAVATTHDVLRWEWQMAAIESSALEGASSTP
ncbi:MAG: glycosyltransferase [Actinobacteria bacterium]|nr:glycosyltransferase [Actinomycetota bacterium]